MRVQIDAFLCDGCGPCEDTCPEIFEVTERLARVKQAPVPPWLEAACRQAAGSCPNRAIIIDEWGTLRREEAAARLRLWP